MESYFERDSKAGDHGEVARSKRDCGHQPSRYFISLTNASTEAPSDRTSSRGAGGGDRDGGAGGRWAGESKTPGSLQQPDSIEDCFSSLANDSFCRHKFTLSSRIFSSRNFREEQTCNVRDTELTFTRRGDSNCYLDSSESSSDHLAAVPSSNQLSDGEPWGWFDEVDESVGEGGPGPPPVTKLTPPYILTESLSAQRLWRETAGKRPRQPSDEREFFEEQWAKNFSDSEVDYSAPLTEADAASKKKRARKVSKLLYRATSPFGSAVSKSFECNSCRNIASIMVHIPKFQIVQTGSDVHAEYLVVVGTDIATVGVWRRFSDFKRLAYKLSCSSDRDQFHNTLSSWRCLKERQRWFRCLDKDYLILKTFLLERFLHDFVFESVSPNTVREFLG